METQESFSNAPRFAPSDAAPALNKATRLHAMLSKNAIYWVAGIAAAAIAVVSAALIVRLPIAWPSAQEPPAVVSPSANSTVATPADGPTAASEPSPSKPAVQRPAFDVVRVEPTGDAVIAGHAAPNAAIELRADGRVVAHASANESGDFTILPPPFSTGGHHLELDARTGEAAAVLSDSVAIDVPAPAAKASTSIAPAAPRADVSEAPRATVAIPSAAAASTPGIASSKPDAVSAPPADRGVAASAPGSVAPAKAAHVLMRTIEATDAGRRKRLSAAMRSPEAMPEPMPDREAAAPVRGGGHR
jgi:hypothetical protein